MSLSPSHLPANREVCLESVSCIKVLHSGMSFLSMQKHMSLKNNGIDMHQRFLNPNYWTGITPRKISPYHVFLFMYYNEEDTLNKEACELVEQF